MTISAELQPLQHRIDKAMHTMQDLKKGGLYTNQEVARVQNLLHKVDEEYKEGKFEKHGKVPKGQAELADSLNKAHELAIEMLNDAKDAGDAK